MTPTEIQTIHEEIDAAIKAIGRKYNFTVDRSSCSYDNYGFKLTLSATQLNADGSRKTDARIDSLIKSAIKDHTGVEPIIGIGLRFTDASGVAYEITNYNTRARKYPIEYRRLSDGACFKAATEYIAALVKRVA